MTSNKKKPEVSIGIPAYNEEANVGNLLESLIKQNEAGFYIGKIIVVSDGSTDGTAQKVSNFRDSRIELINSEKREGKPARINQIFSRVQSDIVVIMDADIKLASTDVVRDLVYPLIREKEIFYSSGFALPLPPETFIQKIAWTGVDMWNEIRKSKYGSPLYFSEGSIRAFKKKIYKEMIFPEASADDVYPFLYCAKKKYPFVSVEKALVYYKLPETFRDYMKQYKRFIKSRNIQENNYDRKFVDKFYTIKFRAKAVYLFERMKKDFVWTALYLVTVFVTRVIFVLDKSDTEAIWEVIMSSKKLD